MTVLEYWLTYQPTPADIQAAFTLLVGVPLGAFATAHAFAQLLRMFDKD